MAGLGPVMTMFCEGVGARHMAGHDVESADPQDGDVVAASGAKVCVAANGAPGRNNMIGRIS
jgi:hypothetical protein